MKKLTALFVGLFTFSFLLVPLTAGAHYDPYTPYTDFSYTYSAPATANYPVSSSYYAPASYNYPSYQNTYYTPSYSYQNTYQYDSYNPYGDYGYRYRSSAYTNNKSSAEELKYVTDLEGNIIGEYRGGPSSYKPVIQSKSSYQPNNALTTDKIITVAMKNNKYSPATITIKKGTTIKWVNYDSVKHTVTGDKSSYSINSGIVLAGKSYQKTFNTAGTYYYHCNYHSTMNGKIIVTN
jgi:plastocyanin